MFILVVVAFTTPLTFAKMNDTASVLTAQQTDFLAAEKLLRQAKWNDFDKKLDHLGDYPLAIYLERDRLLANLSLANSSLIESFLNQHGDLPVSRKLRYKWLHWLAKNNHSSLFLRHYRNFGSTQLSCKQLEFRLKTSENPQDIYPLAKSIWLTGRSLPKACDKLISTLKQSGQITDEMVWQRFVLAVKARQRSLAQYLARKLPPSEQEAAQLLQKVAKSPEKLNKVDFRNPLTDKAVDIIDFALYRLAWDDPNLAIDVWKKLGKKHQFTDRTGKLKRAISLSLAIDKDPKAANWLASIEWRGDESVNQWLLSTAIADQNWQLITELAADLSQQSQESNKWFYWQAVAETQLGNLNKAQSIFESLSQERSYYGFLSARQLGKQAELKQRTISYDQHELAQYTQKPSARRAREFLALGRLNDARREWNYVVQQTPLEDQTKLALIAHQWQWQHQAILAFARSKQIDDVEKRFPLHQLSLFEAQAKENQIPLSWAYAITRQESAFKTDAVSSAGARGLMQLKPSTARMVVKHRKSFKRASQLLNADMNIKLGTAHLSKMYESFNDHPILATAAYNAGKAKVQKWLENNNTRDPLQWIEQIPYKETREYVKNVLTYQLIYARLTNQPEDFIAQIDNFPITTPTILTK
ncbi:hypothetical protein FLL45_02615 [Aliikangiella marina]|uniref:Lytic murein transglycosylase n=1 Tax=Aliikangiella marina TaxID=1712262 RepID=A0A545TI12_9GAMM|nr:transglycosylase SLT domain-containing protein [Aliikangiella marina]TQV76867.1 hypothetical protein FLL45_02615 [Aliikangiella marina]